MDLKHTTTWVAAAAAVCAVLLGAAETRANDLPLSKQHFERAVKLAELGKHTEAIREFELSYDANPRVSTLYNIAREHELLAAAGSIDEMRKSIDFYQRYLNASPKASDRRIVESRIIDLKARAESAEAAERANRTQQPPQATTPSPGSAQSQAAQAAAVPSPAAEPSPAARAKVPAWGWALVATGAVVVIGGAVGLGVGLSATEAPGADFQRTVSAP